MEDKPSEEQLAEFKEAFCLFDKDGDGCIVAKELGPVMRALGQNPTESELHDMIFSLDCYHTIDFPDFASLMCKYQKNTETEEIVIGPPKYGDYCGNGLISAAEARHVLENLGKKITDTEVEEIIKECDYGDGQIDYEQLVKLVMSK